MRIASSAVDLQSRHAEAFRQTEQETLRMWRGERPDFEGRNKDRTDGTHTLLSEAARALTAQMRNTAEAQTRAAESDAMDAITSDPADSDPLLSLLKSMIEMLTGETIHTVSAQAFTGVSTTTFAAANSQQQAAAASRSAAGANYGIEYDYHSVREEYERSDFSAQGSILTSDGARIDFRLDLTMERYHREETSVSVRAGNALRKDPLVINFDGTAAQLASQRFRFDLNGDGRADNLPLLGSGSGYLAIDANLNGRIDSGAELFGPASNSGFGELAALDSDGNGWIDENDPAYDLLRVWQPDAKGEGTVATLRERNVGALYLGRTSTAFELRDAGNRDLGAVRESGIYLTESGKAGTIQEIDITL